MALVKAYGFRQQLGTTAVRVRRGLAWLKKDGPLYGGTGYYIEVMKP